MPPITRPEHCFGHGGFGFHGSTEQSHSGAEIGDTLDLRIDLGQTDDLKRSLAPPFERIARRFKHTASVSMDECSALDTVKAAIVLVSSKAGFGAAETGSPI